MTDNKKTDYQYKRTPKQWLILSLTAMISFSLYYCYELPSSLSVALMARLMGLGGLDGEGAKRAYSWFSPAYSLPNVILPLVVGKWVDSHTPPENSKKTNGEQQQMQTAQSSEDGSKKDGFAEKVLVSLTAMMAFGHLMFVEGLRRTNLTIMLLGRLLFGAGSESISVVQARLVTITIPKGRSLDSELASIMAMLASVSSLGTIACNLVCPYVKEQYGLMPAVMISAGLCLLVVGMALAVVFLRSSHPMPPKNTLPGKKTKRRTPSVMLHTQTSPVVMEEQAYYASCSFKKPAMVQWTEKSKAARFWTLSILAGISFFYMGCIYAYRCLSEQYYTATFYPLPEDRKWMSLAMAFPDAIAICLGLIQLLVPAHFICLTPMGMTLAGGVLFVSAHGALLVSSSLGGSPFFPALVFLGVAETAVFAGWSIVPAMLPSSYQTTAYGLMTAMCNLAISLIPPLVTALLKACHPGVNNSDSYGDNVVDDVEWRVFSFFFMGLGGAGTVLSILLWLLHRACSETSGIKNHQEARMSI